MANTREQLIEWLETGQREFANYKPEDKELFGNLPAMSRKFGAIAELLKLQVPADVVERPDKFVCPRCGLRLAGRTTDDCVLLETNDTPNYCWACGQAVKWE